MGSFGTVLSFLLALVVFGAMIVAVLRWRAALWSSGVGQLANISSPQQATALEAELRSQWDSGEQTLEAAVKLSQVYLMLKHPQVAEEFAREACEMFATQVPVGSGMLLLRGLRDNAYLALAQALVMQGHFAEAAHELDTYRRNFPVYSWNMLAVYATFAYLLASDESQAHFAAADIQSVNQRDRGSRLAVEFEFLAAYLQLRLLGVDTLATLDALSKQFLAWINTYRAAVNFPVYQARLREIIDDMATVVPLGWARWAGMRMIMHETAALITENEAKRAAGDDSYPTALVLARAYANHGYGAKAEPLAREAFAAIQAEGWFARNDPSAQYLTDIVYGAVYDALMQLGRFGEAADLLLPVVSRSAAINLYLVFCAWGYFLAEEHDQARQTLDQVLPIQPTQDRFLSPRYALLYPYLKFRLGMVDSPAELAVVQANRADWQEILDLLVDNPYRRAVQAMVEDVRALAGMETPPESV